MLICFACELFAWFCVFVLIIAVWLLLGVRCWVIAGFDTCVVVWFAVLVVGF